MCWTCILCGIQMELSNFINEIKVSRLNRVYYDCDVIFDDVTILK